VGKRLDFAQVLGSDGHPKVFIYHLRKPWRRGDLPAISNVERLAEQAGLSVEKRVDSAQVHVSEGQWSPKDVYLPLAEALPHEPRGNLPAISIFDRLVEKA